ncbi:MULTISPECIES: hypothetical protein [unclassified Fibrobacter]|uniref:hypothetical protein n=1 Tax=unclassified Fibrobacter TaxID=2634177 RepID=UPI000D795E9D|nr:MULTISPECIES: hypothetical protein [unclassified Fibrobacter]PWJ69951.1 hypothetical protein BGX12_10429 [Fibrobacter sp. UWR4]PZW73122.1 hypothetical protein C8E88_100429 [Fibrobacter sp. UWR1]
MRKIFALSFLLLPALSMTGCLSHWFMDTESRLQVENGMEDMTIYSLDVLSEDSSTYEKWIDESIEPGDRSHVAAADWVGEFNIRLRYGKADGDTLQNIRKMEISGGSMYLKITAEDDSLVYTFK